jgi:N6-adenosine-specific RNA methylase IME4
MSAEEDYGALKAYVHIAGYSFERAALSLESLLNGDDWQRVGTGFTGVNDFLDSLRLDQLRGTIEQRKRIARRIKELQPAASVRQIARTLGVDHVTVLNDLRAGENSPAGPSNARQNQGGAGVAGENSPLTLSGAQAAKLVKRRETGAADRLARVAADEARILKLVPVAGKFRTIVLDPAWEYEQSIAGRAKPAYALQTHEVLLGLDVRAWADPIAGCHLYVWVTNAFMARACELVAHWGFQHRVVLTWIKPPPFGLGSYFRNSTELVIFATLGETTTRPAAASLPTHFEAPRGEHSEKPERFYDIVRAASYPPYGEGNQRDKRPGFVNLFREVEAAAE